MNLAVMPCINSVYSRDDYTGFSEFQELVASDECSGFDLDAREDLDLGVEGYEIQGRWSDDKQSFHGFFPTYISEDGTRTLCHPRGRELSVAAVHTQIQLAKEYQIPLGLAVRTYSISHLTKPNVERPNAVLYGSNDAFRSLRWPLQGRLETDGSKFWCYARLPFEDDEELKKVFAESRHQLFALDGSNAPAGAVLKHETVPVAPSYVLDRQVRLVSLLVSRKFLWASSSRGLGLHFEVEDEVEDLYLDEQLEPSEPNGLDDYFPSPEEEERLFEEAVRRFESSTSIGSRNLSNDADQGHDRRANAQSFNQLTAITLEQIFPLSIARALRRIGENLPYDDVSMAMVFMTSMANMLRLGTCINGNQATKYEVPINIYLALIARSGKKKTPLLKFFSDDPVAEVLQQTAAMNTRLMSKWQNDCRGQSKDQRPPKPVPLELRINDYTGEALVVALKKSDEQGRAILIQRDEIKAIFTNLNAYRAGRGADEQQLLELYDGTSYRALRIGDGERGYSRAAVNILGAIQPGVLQELIRSGDDSGQWARFSFSILPDWITPLPTVLDPDLINAREAAALKLQAVASWLYQLSARTYFLDTESVELFSRYEFQKQADAQASTLSAHASLFGKSAGKVLRYAGLLHLLWSYDKQPEPSEQVPARILKTAIRLCDFLDANTLELHAKVASTTLRSVGFSAFTRRIHQIAFKSKLPVSWTEIRKQMSSAERKDKTVDDARESMKQLEAAGLGKIVEGDRGGLSYQALKPLP